MRQKKMCLIMKHIEDFDEKETCLGRLFVYSLVLMPFDALILIQDLKGHTT